MADWLISVHVGCVVSSFSYFLLRCIWTINTPAILERKLWSRYVTDAIDTLLLASGVGLMFSFGLYPDEQPWLAVKLVAVVVYIAIAHLALKRCRSTYARAAAWSMAALVFFYTAGVAVHHDPWSWLQIS